MKHDRILKSKNTGSLNDFVFSMFQIIIEPTSIPRYRIYRKDTKHGAPTKSQIIVQIIELSIEEGCDSQNVSWLLDIESFAPPNSNETVTFRYVTFMLDPILLGTGGNIGIFHLLSLMLFFGK